MICATIEQADGISRVRMHMSRALLALVFLGACGPAPTTPVGVSTTPPAPAPAAAPTEPAVGGTCAGACERVVQCNAGPSAACLEACQRSSSEATPGGRDQLLRIEQMSCDELVAAMRPQGPAPAPPAPAPAPAPTNSTKGQVLCNAEGVWESCARGFCTPRHEWGMGVGPNEHSARILAEANCSQHMTNLMIIDNLNNQARVRDACRSTTCRR